ncbi:MAG: hypothetical protein ABSC04_13775 [Syntrophobacteraceae bacterium]
MTALRNDHWGSILQEPGDSYRINWLYQNRLWDCGVDRSRDDRWSRGRNLNVNPFLNRHFNSLFDYDSLFNGDIHSDGDLDSSFDVHRCFYGDGFWSGCARLGEKDAADQKGKEDNQADGFHMISFI